MILRKAQSATRLEQIDRTRPANYSILATTASFLMPWLR
jgi:hypothetical protein